MARSRSGLAWASCSSSQPETSILGPAASAWLLLIEIFGRNSMRITRWPSHVTTPRSPAETSNTTSVDATKAPPARSCSRGLFTDLPTSYGRVASRCATRQWTHPAVHLRGSLHRAPALPARNRVLALRGLPALAPIPRAHHARLQGPD